MHQKILRRPIFSEKTRNKAALSIYTFEVENNASKKDIKRAIETQFGVKVKKTRTRTQKPKRRRAGKRRYEVQVKAFKIAEVTLAKDQKIDLWEVPKKEAAKEKKEKKEKKTMPAGRQEKEEKEEK